MRHPVVEPAVGIGEQLACRQVQGREAWHAAHCVVGAGCFQGDAHLEHDLEFDGLIVHPQPRADAVLIRPQITEGVQRRGARSRHAGETISTRERLPQLTIGRQVGDEEIDVHRFPVFAMAKRAGGASTEEATAFAQQFAVERLQHARHALVMRSLKHPPGPAALRY